LSSIDDMDRIVLSQQSGLPVLLRDVAKNQVGFTPRMGIAGRDTQDDVLFGIVLMQKNERTMDVVTRVRAAIDRINSDGSLPQGVRVDTFYDRGDLVGVTVHTVLHNMLFGIVLIFLIQWIFLGNLRCALIVAATIPVALATVVVIGLYVRQERAAVRAGSANPAKWHYLAGTGALTAALAVDPAAGLIAFVTGHALEYVVVVDRTLRRRYADSPEPGAPASLLSVLAGTRNRRIALLVGFFAVFAIVDLQLRGVLSADVYLVVVYTIGLLHFLYDGFIWKTRRPAVAADFGVPAAPTVQ
jgi:hypothetical protein